MKLAVFVDTGWSLGQMYRVIARHLEADIFDWAKPPPDYTWAAYDRILTLPAAGSTFLVNQGVSRSKILLVAHAECDLIQLVRREGTDWSTYAGFGAVSDTLACSALTLGITRVPTVLRQGIPCTDYETEIPYRLGAIGYGAIMSRNNEYGVEIKRGWMAAEVARRLGLTFKPAVGLTREEMPGYYQSIDAVLMTSLQEGGAMPPYEAAASGRLVIGTPVGDFPRLALEGLGVLAPLGEDAFIEFAVATLGHFVRNPEEFQLRCAATRSAARRQRDWPVVVEDWRAFAFREA